MENITFEESLEQIEKLVKSFKSNSSYKSMDEENTKMEYINPMFEALGWDISNKENRHQNSKEVLFETKVEIKSSKSIKEGLKSVDYSFRLGGVSKFFVEAKKPSVIIIDDITTAFQIRRYGWSANLPLNILTDFEEFAIYDCRIKPDKKDKSSIARKTYFTYTDYVSRWKEVWDLFSKTAIDNGSLEYYKETKLKGTTTVDAEFLKSIENWRFILAKNIALRNPDITEENLNYSVQKIIDRIIFLRICESRGIEAEENLKNAIAKENTYNNLLTIFNKADAKYNSGLFHFSKEKNRAEAEDSITPSLIVDDKILKLIIEDLYSPNPYEFSVFPAEILGSVYEQFLGKVIVHKTQSKSAKVEDKPEVKKAGGVFYTPAYIVNYIVENTIGEQIKEKKPIQVDKLKFVDPACGSGSFLIVAYQYLLDWYLEYYSKNDSKNFINGKNPKLFNSKKGLQLTLFERKRILLNNIYGVDIDAQAVEVTKLSLLLKVLEYEGDEVKEQKLFEGDRVLPDLYTNIKCGNSLVGTDISSGTLDFEVEELKKIKPFDWKIEFKEIMGNGGFDCVIGNPPYGAELSKKESEYLEIKFKLNNTNSAALFMGLGNNIITKNGLLSYIIPKSFIYASNWETARKQIVKGLIESVDCGKVWKNVKLEQVIFLYSNSVSQNYISSIRDRNEIIKLNNINKKFINEFGFILNGVSKTDINIAIKMKNFGENLNDYVFNQRGAPIQKHVEKTGDYKVLGGRQLSRYYLPEGIKGMIKKENIQDNKAFIKNNSVLVQRIVSHMSKPKPHTKIRANLPDFINKKLFILVDTINQLTVKIEYSNKYILAFLNSKLISWYVYKFIFAMAIITMQFDNPTSSRIPMPKFDKSIHDKLVNLVDKMLTLQKHYHTSTSTSIQEKPILEKQIQAIDNEIDKVVYKLYDLTDDEIKTVEDSLG